MSLARYSALTFSQRRSSASALSGSALRIGKSLARSKRANVFAARKVHWTLRLSGSANRGDFSRIMQLEIVDSRYALSEKAGRRANYSPVTVGARTRFLTNSRVRSCESASKQSSVITVSTWSNRAKSESDVQVHLV